MSLMGKIGAAVIAAILAGGASAEPTFNEPPSGSDVAKIELDRERALGIMLDFAGCVARLRTQKSEDVLALPYGSAEQQAAARGLVANEGECLGRASRSWSQMAFQAELMLGGIAEYLVDKRYDPAGALTIAVSVDAAGVAPRNGIEMFGQCVTRGNPDAVLALLETDPATDEEADAFATLGDPLAQCVSEGQTLALSKSGLRALLAVSLYRLLPLAKK